MKYAITSDTLRHGRVTRKIMAANYPDALEIMDRYVDELDGVWKQLDVDNLPLTATFDELLSGKYGDIANYCERYGRWQILLVSGWFYIGSLSNPSAPARLCRATEKLDPHTIH